MNGYFYFLCKKKEKKNSIWIKWAGNLVVMNTKVKLNVISTFYVKCKTTTL